MPDESAAVPQPLPARVVANEMRDFVRTHERRRRQMPRAALTGLLAGFLGVVFRSALDLCDDGRDHFIAYAHSLGPWGILLPVLLSACGAGFGLWLVAGFAPDTAGSGIPQIKAVLHHLRGMSWRSILPVKFVAGLSGIGSGMALGREGPTVQMGGAVGQMVGEWLNVTPRERQTLIAAGSGAGLAAAFNAPLAGLMFVLEELQRDFTPAVFTATFMACVVSDVVTRLCLGQLPVFRMSVAAIPSLTSLPTFLVLGVAAGLMGVVFNRSLVGSLNLFLRAKTWPRGTPGVLVGAAAGLIGWFTPSVLGGGNGLVQDALSGHMRTHLLPLTFCLRFGLTMTSYGCGAAGGIFAPLLVLGSQIGLMVGELGQRLTHQTLVSPETFAVVGMAAYFTAIVRAPLTGIVLIIEMTGDYSLMLPLLVACFSAYGVADLLGDAPIYEALLERNLMLSEGAAQLDSALMLELPVQYGSRFDGQHIGDLEAPEGCLIVSVEHGLKHLVATPQRQLHAGDRLTALISPENPEAALWLRSGTTPDG